MVKLRVCEAVVLCEALVVEVEQPRRSWAQHHALLSSGQSLSQSLYPTLQSNVRGLKGVRVEVVLVVLVVQPLPTYWQHQACFEATQPSCQFDKPAEQS